MDFKIVVLGPSNAGKTSIIERYCSNTFHMDSLSTIGAQFFTKALEVDGKAVNLYIWDTAGDERFSSMSTSYIHGSDGLVLVFDTMKPDFTSLYNFLTLFNESVENDKTGDVPILVLGNKIDLIKEKDNEMEMLETVENDISKFCSSHGIKDFALVSAKEDTGIDEGFETIARKMMQNTQSVVTPKIALKEGREVEKDKCC